MRLLRTAAGAFINATAIARLKHDDDGAGWLAVLAEGKEVLLAPYYSTPGRIEQDFPHLVPDPAAPIRTPAGFRTGDRASELLCDLERIGTR